MEYKPFWLDYPKIAERQTRTIKVLGETAEALPLGEFAFLEFFCSDKKCDCRRAMIFVIPKDPKEGENALAVISYGWEPKSFYKAWSPSMTPEMLDWFKGPALEPFKPQSAHAQAFLENFKANILDANYRNRLIQHYVLAKQKQGMKLPKDLLAWTNPMWDCGCGSGLKFKFCCGANKSGKLQ